MHWNPDALIFKESNESVFLDYGIETQRPIPQNDGLFSIANHLRAILDYLENNTLLGMKDLRNSFICVEKYDYEFFDKVLLLNNLPHWPEIDHLMCFEFYRKWLNYRRNKNVKSI